MVDKQTAVLVKLADDIADILQETEDTHPLSNYQALQKALGMLSTKELLTLSQIATARAYMRLG